MLLQEIQRNHRAMVERGLLFPQKPCRETCSRAVLTEPGRQSLIILSSHPDLCCPELTEIALRPAARRDMEIIRIHDRMWTGHDNRIRPQGCRPFHDLMISIDRPLDFLFLTTAHCRYDQGRMWYHHSC